MKFNVFSTGEKDFCQHIMRRHLTYLHMETNSIENVK